MKSTLNLETNNTIDNDPLVVTDSFYELVIYEGLARFVVDVYEVTETKAKFTVYKATLWEGNEVDSVESYFEGYIQNGGPSVLSLGSLSFNGALSWTFHVQLMLELYQLCSELIPDFDEKFNPYSVEDLELPEYLYM